MVAIVDYGVGNLFSLKSSLAHIGAEVVVTNNKEKLANADQIILPGVGAFEDAAKKLRESGLDLIIKELVKNGKPLMGICLGMQMLFEKSYEFGEHNGLGLIKGSVVPMKDRIPESLNIPHIGSNALEKKKDSSVLKYVNDGDCVYFVHSFCATDCDDNITAVTDYGIPITASVQSDNIYGCQFHPEKSGKVGLNILRAFCELGE